jgi:hypothetical protein
MDTVTTLKAAFVAQLVEHLHGKEGVIGSNPIKGSKKNYISIDRLLVVFI